MTTAQAGAYEACEALLDGYPLAADCQHGARSMALMVPGKTLRFYVLAHFPEAGDGPACALYPWQAPEDGAEIRQGAGVPGWVPGVLAAAVPVPRDGAMFGYAVGAEITALIPVYGYAEDHPEPSYTVMPRAGISRDLWPAFTSEPMLGHWFWDCVRAGRLISLGPVIAGTCATVFWVPLDELDGCVRVTCDVLTPAGEVLGAGIYAWSRNLDAGVPLPDGLEGATDLAPRFAPEDGHARRESDPR